MRLLLLAVFLASLLVACDETRPTAPDAAGGGEFHCDSLMRWCEDGQIFEGYPRYPNCTSNVCTPGELDFVNSVHICPSGCALFDGGTACQYYCWNGEPWHPEDFCAP